MSAKSAVKRAVRSKVSPGHDAHSATERAGVNSQVGYMLRRAQLAIFNDLIDCFKPFAVRPAQYAVLAVIGANPGINQEQLGDGLAIQRPNLSALLDGLERERLVRRDRTARDGRCYSLRLTSEGATRLRKLHEAHLKHERRIGKVLRPAAKARLLDALAKLAALNGSETD